MKQKHTTRRERQAMRQTLERKIQEVEQRQLPRRAALALFTLRQTAQFQANALQSSITRKTGGAR
jgi:hypothetical protein